MGAEGGYQFYLMSELKERWSLLDEFRKTYNYGEHYNRLSGADAMLAATNFDSFIMACWHSPWVAVIKADGVFYANDILRVTYGDNVVEWCDYSEFFEDFSYYCYVKTGTYLRSDAEETWT